MTIYAISKGEGKNLNVKNTKFFSNKADAEKYRESLTVMGEYHIIRKYDRETNNLLHECVFYSGRYVNEQDKRFADLNQMVNECNPYYIKCEWERRPYNPYVITELNVK